MTRFLFAILFTFTLPANAQGLPRDCTALPVKHDRTLLDRERFTVEVTGTGPDVILIPGLSTPRDVWADTVAALAGCYRVHSVQIRGFGDDAGINAGGPVLEPFIAEMADYIDDQIVEKGRPAPAIIGHSLGGLAALMIGARSPKVAGRIMVVDALPFFGTIIGAHDVAAARPQVTAMAMAIRARYRADAPPPALIDCDDPAKASGIQSIWSITPRGRCLVENWGRQSDPRVSAQALLDDATTDMRGELGNIAAPVTLLFAQDNSVMPEAMMRDLYSAQYAGTPNLTPVMIRGSYHFIMIDQPALLNAQVVRFLEDRDQGPMM
jgi:pimeloyl-ACP methyl ester carboxylesterase